MGARIAMQRRRGMGMVLLLNIEVFSGIITSPSTRGLFCEESQMFIGRYTRTISYIDTTD
jgi:hypothetical protein